MRNSSDIISSSSSISGMVELSLEMLISLGPENAVYELHSVLHLGKVISPTSLSILPSMSSSQIITIGSNRLWPIVKLWENKSFFDSDNIEAMDIKFVDKVILLVC